MTDIIPLDEKEIMACLEDHSQGKFRKSDIKLALQNFQKEMINSLDTPDINDLDFARGWNVCIQIQLQKLKEIFGTSFTETSPSNFCEKGMQETLSATKETSDGVERHTKTLGSNL